MTVPSSEGFLGELTEGDRHALLGTGRRRHVRRGDTVMVQGDRTDRLAVVLKGCIKAVSLAENGSERILGVRGPGQLVGELAALGGGDRSAAVVALEPTELLMLTTREFETFLGERPGSAMVLIRMLVHRLREADESRTEFGAHDATSRLVRLLVRLSDEYGVAKERGVTITLPLTQSELANWIGCSREAVAKSLRGLRDAALVETSRRALVVLDCDRLRQRARLVGLSG
jgi:CRP-like cAMP-binding protein